MGVVVLTLISSAVLIFYWKPKHLASFTHPDDDLRATSTTLALIDSNEPLAFKVADIPGKGKGMIATRDIQVRAFFCFPTAIILLPVNPETLYSSLF